MSDRERLIGLLVAGMFKFSEKGFVDNTALADFLLEHGVIVPPCKVGDTVYQLDTAGNIYESKISKTIYDTNGIAFDERAIGKSVFLTIEEAEKARMELKQ